MTHTFTARIQAADRGGAFVTVPFDVEAAFGSKRPKVAATFDGAPYRGSLVRMGGPDHLLIVRRDIRDAIGKQPGDEVTVTVALDTAPRVVTPPDPLAAGMGEAERAAWDDFSFTCQREIAEWITEAKREATRERRVAETLQALAQGRSPR